VRKQNAITLALAGAGLMLGVGAAQAEPILQLYIDGATYDSTTETWVLNSGDPFTLWVIGNTTGGGGQGTIDDVKLSVAYSNTLDPIISLTGTTTGNATFTDPSTPSDPTFIQQQDGTQPLLGDGSSLPAHGIYGDGTEWQEFFLGDFTLSDSPLGDFITSFPSPSCTNCAQINAYTVDISGVAEGSVFHFDAYDHVFLNENHLKYVFAPFSHDAEGGTNGKVPEPATSLLMGLGLLGLMLGRRYLKY
jgi:hypothetical protein